MIKVDENIKMTNAELNAAIKAEWEKVTTLVKSRVDELVERAADTYGVSTSEAKAVIITSILISNRMRHHKRKGNVPALIFWSANAITFRLLLGQKMQTVQIEKALAAQQVRR